MVLCCVMQCYCVAQDLDDETRVQLIKFHVVMAVTAMYEPSSLFSPFGRPHSLHVYPCRELGLLLSFCVCVR